MIKMILVCILVSQPTGAKMHHVFESTVQYETMEQCEAAIHTNNNAAGAQHLFNTMRAYGMNIEEGQFKCISEMDT